MRTEDEEKTSFITPFGTYCFVRMPEGLKNAGQSFSRMTSKVLESQLKRNILAYVDDIVIISAARQDHIKDLAETSANLRKANLSLNPEKCVFGYTRERSWDAWFQLKALKQIQTKLQLSATWKSHSQSGMYKGSQEELLL